MVLRIGLLLNQIGTKDEKVGWGWDNGYDYRPTVLIRLPSALWPPCFLPITSLWFFFGFSMVFLWFFFHLLLLLVVKRRIDSPLAHLLPLRRSIFRVDHRACNIFVAQPILDKMDIEIL